MTATNVDEVPVLFSGGGLVGLSTAMFLAQHGISSVAIERLRGGSPVPRAAFFHMRTLEMFRAAGIEDKVRERSAQEFEPAEVIVPSRPPRVDLRRIRERLYELNEELRFAREVLRQVALALGSCHCVGEDPDCDDCQGRGVPGTLDPEPASFARYVLPAMRKMKESRRGTAAQVPSQESTGRDETSAERSST